MTTAGWWNWCDEGLRLETLVQPRAKREGVTGIHDQRLRICVRSAPVDGKANDALISWLAKEFGVPRGRVRLLAGQSGRRKTLLVASPSGNPAWFLELGGRARDN